MGISIKSSAVGILLAVFINLAAISVYGQSLLNVPAADFSDDDDMSIANRNRGDPKDFPYIAFIEHPDRSDFKYCVGTIIHENWILTTAGCSRTWLEPDQYTVIVGLGLKRKENGTRYAIEDIVIQPNVPDELIYNHFNLFKTEASIRMNKLVQPIALNENVIKNTRRGIIARWQLVGEHI